MRLGVSHQAGTMLTPGHLAYLRQMGVESVEVRIPDQLSTYDEMARIRDRVEEAGLHLFEIMRGARYDSPEIALGLPGRDREIERFKSFLKDLARVGVDCTTYTWCSHSHHYGGGEDDDSRVQNQSVSPRGGSTRAKRLQS